ncbi:SIR2 family protein [Sedimentitalea nanhaiensis]|uniref:NAD-dependent protein deacetylase, SIR2 family n=1 Tax=Sedimentitalea nanhaiensis TaxID=999627 RepID=A0A1I7CR40_9RHOB|nr:SIR2 family protein [Sedimentitalea nanhaiensis]SFU01900.1 NAD-dependent protein deacetylase, SIR2 family [Sedimentitalea nanhaiensis]
MKEFIGQVDPEKTVLLFGAGASIPSGAPGVDALVKHFADKYDLDHELDLAEITFLAEKKTSRRKVITDLRRFFPHVKPKGGLLKIPRWRWKGIYTTNYDTLVEQAFERANKKCRVYSSNFDFHIDEEEFHCEFFKIHGTIDKDVSDGNQSRIILTVDDYDQTEDFREQLYDRMRGDLAGADLVIIGQSLSDPDMDALVKRAAKINANCLSPGQITLLIYTENQSRAQLQERKGLRVVFGGVDDFFSELAKRPPKVVSSLALQSDDVLTGTHILNSVVEVSEVSNGAEADVSSMFNGWPASHMEIEAGLTFERDISREIAKHFEEPGILSGVVLGAAGVGKSTAARQALQLLRRAGFRAWEHINEHTLSVSNWRKIAANLKEHELVGVLLVDEAHSHLHQLNELMDLLVADDNPHLKILAVSTKNNWIPRSRTPNFNRCGKDFWLSKLSSEEIDRLLNLIDRQPRIRELVEDSFSGFNKAERRRRLVHRCEADMFVCLKNIFASESFDDIILREFAGLDGGPQDIYKHVAAMETLGVRVHRQLAIRMLKIEPSRIASILESLDDIVEEYPIEKRHGIFGWKCRHGVISEIVTRYKFGDLEQIIALLDRVIDNISPSYDIEVRTLRELCNLDGGLSRIPEKKEQNRLLRRMISMAPGERVPRHRLIRNLIDQGEFEKAETEIRVFNYDFGSDGPVHRYKIKLMVARAARAPGLLDEDRIAILEQAQELASTGVARFPNNKSILSAYAELGLEYLRRTGSYSFFDAAMDELKAAEARLGDADITTMISRFERRAAGSEVDC